MKYRHILYTTLSIMTSLLTACSEEQETSNIDNDKKILSFSVIHPSQTRATETAFEQGDNIGVYVADAQKVLEIGGNVVNNEKLTLSGNDWTTSAPIYWNDGTYNVYAYYPYMTTITSIDYQPFSISTDQSTEKAGSRLGGYEASDLLFAQTKDVKATNSPVNLTFSHIMSKLKIRLVKGEDYEGEMPKNAKVYIHSTLTSASIDLAAGIATPDSRKPRQIIKAHKDDDYIYSAIIVPQRIDGQLPLVEVVMNGISYLYEGRFVFKQGTQHYINLVISTTPEHNTIAINGSSKKWD